jgi:hypothetical protein
VGEADSGPDSTVGTGGDSGPDSTVGTGGDSGPDASADAAGKDAGPDASADAGDAAVLCTNGSACSIDNLNGVCVAGACAPCDSADGGATSLGSDTACTTAYGGATRPYVCIAGSCAEGNCTANAACAAPTPTCGFASPNFCGGCTSDGQCPTSQICVTASGAARGSCVLASAAGCTTNQSNAVCPDNAADECCGGTCSPGNCCIASGAPTGCTGQAGVACKADAPGELNGGGICTACAAVTGAAPVYYVDPVHGSDVQGTGNNSVSEACAFQTVTRALQVIGTTPLVDTTIDIVGGTTDAGVVTVTGVATGTPATGQELFPLTLRANITVTNSAGPVTIEVPARAGGVPTTGFVLTGASSAIVGGSGGALVVDGQAQAASVGVLVQTPGASLTDVTVQNFATVDVEVNGATAASALAIGSGVQCLGSGVEGLLITGAGASATVTPGVGGHPILFNGNTAHGIRVMTGGILTLTGTVGATPPSSSTVVANGNGIAGIWVQTASATQSVITGVVSTGSTAGNGIRIIPGSNVQVRNSWLLGNSHGSGIDVENNGGAVVGTVNNIDLGTGTTGAAAGGNVLQAVSGGNPNANAGICLTLPGADTPVTLMAEGNIFQNGANCATTADTLVTRPGFGCAGGADVGGSIVATAAAAGTGDKIDVTMCTVP